MNVHIGTDYLKKINYLQCMKKRSEKSYRKIERSFSKHGLEKFLRPYRKLGIIPDDF